MFFSPRIRVRALSQLCYRLGMALEAGIDVRTIWVREAERAHGAMRRRLFAISHGIDQGESVSLAMRATGDYFPSFVYELVEVGEQAGHLDGIFAQLAEHYEAQLTLQRNFIRAITWPVIQLTMALGVIGLLILLMGFLREMQGNEHLDILGFGLVGVPGLEIYLTILAGIGLVLGFLIRAIRRGVIWVRPVQYFVMALPGIGSSLRTLALSRLTWSLHLTLNAGMPLRRALQLSLRSTHNICFVDHIAMIDTQILAGNTLHEAFRETGAYPHDFLDSLAVAEESGKIVETMAILTRQYRERARAAVVTLTTLAGWAVWVVITVVIVFMIFRVAGFYLNTLNNAVQGYR